MMASTEPNFTTHSFRGNEGAVLFGSVTAKYSISGNDRLVGVLILWWAMKRISLASTHDPICVEKGGEENTLKYSYLQITVCMSPCPLRGGEGSRNPKRGFWACFREKSKKWWKVFVGWKVRPKINYLKKLYKKKRIVLSPFSPGMQEHVAGRMGNVRNTCIKNIQIILCDQIGRS